MTEQSPSTWIERIETLPFPAYLGLGAATGLLAVLLAASSVKSGAADVREPVDGAVADAGVAAPERSVPSAAAPSHDAAQNRAASPGAGASAAESANAKPEPPAEAEAPSPADEPTREPAPEPEPEVVLEDDAPVEAEDTSADGTASGAEQTPAGRTTAERAAEAEATPAELYALAKTAYDEGRYKDAYRLATRSHRAKASDKTQMLRGRAACRIKDQKNAKAIVKSFKLGDERRKTLRTFCKDRGVKVGL